MNRMNEHVSDGAVQAVLVDDDPEIRQLVSEYLSRHGIEIVSLPDASRLRSLLDAQEIDIVLLDIMLPGEDGLSLCRELREERNLPVIMLTALAEESDRVVGLEMGADDYVTKPFSNRELLARIRAVLRRSDRKLSVHQPDEYARYEFACWTLHPGRRELFNKDGVLISLTGGEFDLLLAFLRRPQEILSRELLLDLTKGRSAKGFDRSIDVQLSRLRRKLGDTEIIKTVRGGGYLLATEVAAGNE